LSSTHRPPIDAFDVEPSEARPPDSVEELDRLRRLLIGAERDEIARIKARLDEMGLTVEELSELLPAAIEARNKRDNRLGEALSPTIEQSLRASVQRNPRALVDAIFPVMGPAIRKAIAEAMSGLIQSLNTAIQHSLSWRGMKWRVEALRAGESFATVVLRHTLVYKVDQVFLFHRETGLLLCEAIDREALQQNPDLVSAMATALKDFARDSFNTGEVEDLSVFQVGEQVVRVEQGPRAIIMALVQGHAPNEVRTVLQSVVEAVHQDLAQELDTFEGDAGPFEAARPLLERALQMRVAQQEKRGISPALAGGAALLIGVVGLWLFFSWRTERRWDRLVDALGSEPGVVVVDATRKRGSFLVSGLRDPLAADLRPLVDASGLPVDDIALSWERYLSLDTTIIARRVRDALGPAAVSFRASGDTVYARGEASHAWIARARRTATGVPGVGTLDLSQLVDTELRSARSFADSIEQKRILFPLGVAQLTPDQRRALDTVATMIRTLAARTNAIGHHAIVELVGRADSIGAEPANFRLSEGRAATVRDVLVARVAAPTAFEIVGLGNTSPLSGGGPGVNRSVSLRVRLEPD
jgi:outer membrane protein OmpA-like peptidoglycan-associated protein